MKTVEITTAATARAEINPCSPRKSSIFSITSYIWFPFVVPELSGSPDSLIISGRS